MNYIHVHSFFFLTPYEVAFTMIRISVSESCDMGKYSTCPTNKVLDRCCIFPYGTRINTICISSHILYNNERSIIFWKRGTRIISLLYCTELQCTRTTKTCPVQCTKKQQHMDCTVYSNNNKKLRCTVYKDCRVYNNRKQQKPGLYSVQKKTKPWTIRCTKTSKVWTVQCTAKTKPWTVQYTTTTKTCTVQCTTKPKPWTVHYTKHKPGLYSEQQHYPVAVCHAPCRLFQPKTRYVGAKTKNRDYDSVVSGYANDAIQ